MVELKTTTKGERAPRAKPTASMSLKLADLVSIKATDVGMSDLAVGPSRTTADGFTDGGISRGERFERELVAWAPAEGDAADGVGLLEDPTMRSNKNGGKGSSWAGGNSSAAGWDQFAANKSKFNVDTTFDENLYTTAIDKNASGGISEAEAARIAREIMSQDSSNIHVQEERGLRVTADYDEEDRYGAVMGTGAAAGGTHRAKAVPKAPAWGGSGAGVTAITGKVAPPPKPNSPPPAQDQDRREEARVGRREAQEHAEPQRQVVHAERQGCGVHAVLRAEETRRTRGSADGLPGHDAGHDAGVPDAGNAGDARDAGNATEHDVRRAHALRTRSTQHGRRTRPRRQGRTRRIRSSTGRAQAADGPAARGDDRIRRRSGGARERARRRERGRSRAASRGARAPARRLRVI